MNRRILAEKIVKYAVLSTATWLCLQIILILGVEKKSFLQLFADIIGGGTVGVIAGAAFFVVFGAIGWVSGAIYGAFGLVALMFGGALSGLGLGSLVHVIRNPDHYSFNWLVILPGIIISFFLIRFVTDFFLIRFVTDKAPHKKTRG